MKRVLLDALGFPVQISDEDTYSNDGFVGNLHYHERKLDELYGVEPETAPLIGERLWGHCLYYYDIEGKPGMSVHTVGVDMRDRRDNLVVWAHEQTHVLQYFGIVEELERRLLREQGVKIDLRKLSKKDEEVAADIGALYALNARGIEVGRSFFADELAPAIDIYERHRLR